jgi:putative colanic acid biosynthesis glycosyltransferase WcaI
MRILVHDYVGHPFQVQLSRALASRGHQVLHVYNGSFQTPHGELERKADDPAGFDVRAIALSQTIPKMNFFRRFHLEREYADKLVAASTAFGPEVVISANTPSIAQHRLARGCRRQQIRLVSWIQDMYGIAAYRLLSHKLPGIGHVVGRYFIALDKRSARSSDAVVVITDDFRGILSEWGVEADRVEVIHNWAPLEGLPMRPRENDWSRTQGLSDGLRFIYSGTLAMKHNPGLLLELARLLDKESLGELIVISEGEGVKWLAEQAAAANLRSLKCLAFQPFEAMPEVLGSADVLVAILEADAGVFSVPSKVLSYLCAGRPLLLAVPRENLAAKIVVECGAGLVVEPNDVAGFCGAARKLIESPTLRQEFGIAARQYAEVHFDIERITDRFEVILRAR